MNHDVVRRALVRQCGVRLARFLARELRDVALDRPLESADVSSFFLASSGMGSYLLGSPAVIGVSGVRSGKTRVLL